MVGKICHIKAKSENGARYDPLQTAAERHGYENLILLCGRHHDVIDDDPDAYTVEYLRRLKLQHEQSATALSEDQVHEGVQTILDQPIYTTGQSGGITAHTVNIHFNGLTQDAAFNAKSTIIASPNLVFTGAMIVPVSEQSQDVWSRDMGRFEKQWATENGQVALVAKFTNEARRKHQNVGGLIRAHLIYRYEGSEIRRIVGSWLEAHTDLAEFRVDQSQELIIAIMLNNRLHSIGKRRISGEIYGERIETETEPIHQAQVDMVLVRLTHGDTGECLFESEFKFTESPLGLEGIAKRLDSSADALPDRMAAPIFPNIKFIRITSSSLLFPDHKRPSFAGGSGVKGIVVYFRNDAIPGISVPEFVSAKAHTRFFDRAGAELVSIDAAPWLGNGTDTLTLDVGATVGIVLAITADGINHYARNALKVHEGFSWSPGETFGFSDVSIPTEAERVEIVLIDNKGRATRPFGFAIVEGWLFDPL